MVLDTETIGLEKQFIYDIGFIVVDNKNFSELARAHYIVRQVYDNRELFATAYYADKKPLYTKLLRQRKAKKMYFGHIMSKIEKLIIKYDIDEIYAYNSNFDERAIKFTSNFYKTKSIFNEMAFVDIMQLAKPLHNTKEYKEFTKNNGMLTAKGLTKRTAETTYAFIKNDPNFVEKHMGLQDCEIELEILKYILGTR